MAYTGDVRTGGPADVRELPELVLSKLSVGPMDNNAYLLRCRRTDAQLLIDAAAEAPRLLDLIGSTGLQTVVTTHAHADHWQALTEVVAATGATTIAHADDAAALPVPVDRTVADGALVAVGAVTLRVVHLAGHTPGGIALVHDDPEGTAHVFTGDSLFPGGVGRTDSPEHFEQLIGDVQRELFGRLPDETWVYPGHGRDTTLGRERPELAAWRARGW